jgi:hypothetical protein
MTDTEKHSCVLYDGERGKFLYTYPREEVSNRRRPLNLPYRDAPDYHRNAYYWWFEYLKRNAGYEKYCRTQKPKKFADLYEHWGNIFEEDDFLDWWDRHRTIFMEPPQRKITLADTVINDDNTITLTIPLELDKTYLLSRFKRAINEHMQLGRGTTSLAKYPLHTKAVVTSIAQHLRVYDKHLAEPELSYWKLADECGLFVNEKVEVSIRVMMSADEDRIRKAEETIVRRRKTSLVERHLTIAKQYIENAGNGQFPKRERQ